MFLSIYDDLECLFGIKFTCIDSTPMNMSVLLIIKRNNTVVTDNRFVYNCIYRYTCRKGMILMDVLIRQYNHNSTGVTPGVTSVKK